ncbi:MAG: YbbR-like domain-containing protein [Muribaculaceae bacterium]|nr:YbbR-like domain-containing protein [Muribaculaceae bacterium]
MKKILSEISVIFRAQRRRDILLYLVFVVIASIFWIMLTLNNDVQGTYEVQLQMVNMPDSATLIQDLPKYIKVRIKDKGTSLVKYSLGSNPEVFLDFEKYRTDNGLLRLSVADMRNLLIKTFGNTGDIISVSPDSLVSHYTYLPGKVVPINFNVDVSANYKYVVNGDIKYSEDSVTIYSVKSILNKVGSIESLKIEERELKDTTYIEIPLSSVENVKIVPSTVTAMIPVEPLIMKTVSVNISNRGVPNEIDLITFPGKVDLKYLVPSSMYRQVQNIGVEVLYEDVDKKNAKLPLYITGPRWDYGDVTLSTDSVEYIVENH